MPPRVGIMGAGAIGCYIGGRLTDSGIPTALVARPSLIREVEEHGLNLSDRSSQLHLEPERVDIGESLDRLRGCDYILVTVKCGDTAGVGKLLAGATDSRSVIVSIQNGVSNARTLRAALPEHRVVAGMVEFNVRRDDGAHFHRGSRGSLAVEAMDPAPQIRDLLAAAGLKTRIERDIRRLLWGKLLMNLGNSINALSGVPIRDMLMSRDYRLVIASCVREGLAALSRAGIRPKLVLPLPLGTVPALLSMPDLVFWALARPLMAFDPQARSSMADDLARKRRTEVDYLNGEIVRLAREHGVEAPVNESIVELVKAAEEGDAAGLSATALREAVGV